MWASLFPLHFGMLSWTLPFGFFLLSGLLTQNQKNPGEFLFIDGISAGWSSRSSLFVLSLGPVKPCHTVSPALPDCSPSHFNPSHCDATRRRLLWLPSDFCSVFSKLSHQPVLLFLRDPYLLSPAHGESSRLLEAQLVSVYLRLENSFYLPSFSPNPLLFSRCIFQRCDRRRDKRCFLPARPAEVERQGKIAKSERTAWRLTLSLNFVFAAWNDKRNINSWGPSPWKSPALHSRQFLLCCSRRPSAIHSINGIICGREHLENSNRPKFLPEFYQLETDRIAQLCRHLFFASHCEVTVKVRLPQTHTHWA